MRRVVDSSPEGPIDDKASLAIRIHAAPGSCTGTVAASTLCFPPTEDAWRIGYGGGFYDRLLRESKKKACALSFEMQMLPEVPFIAGQDVQVNCIVTEKRVIMCDTIKAL